MAWIRFLSDFTFVPDEDRRTGVKYRAGFVGNVRKQCADKAIAAGAAEPTTTPPKEATDAG